jgi:hypothetical protein
MKVLMSNSFLMDELIYDQDTYTKKQADWLLSQLSIDQDEPLQIPDIGRMKLALDWELRLENLTVNVEWVAEIDLNNRVEVKIEITKVILHGTVKLWENMHDSTTECSFDSEVPNFKLDFGLYNDEIAGVIFNPFDMDLDIKDQIITIHL